MEDRAIKRACTLGLSLSEKQAFSGKEFSCLYSSVTVDMLRTGIAEQRIP